MRVEELAIQQCSLAVYYFLLEYNNLENLVKETYISSWPSFSEDLKNRLLFFIGGTKSEILYFDFDTYQLVENRRKYELKALLNELRLIHIMKIERKEHQIGAFHFNIQSLNVKQVELDSISCILKLIDMRNILAHRMTDLDFKEKSVIELISDKAISEKGISWLEEFDLSKMDSATKSIVSNYIYMIDIIEKIRRNDDGITAMDS